LQEPLHLLIIPFFARKNAQVSQSIAETCDQNQKAPVTIAGTISPPILSGINAGICVNLNADVKPQTKTKASKATKKINNRN
jgi:hypothetical protein